MFQYWQSAESADANGNDFTRHRHAVWKIPVLRLGEPNGQNEPLSLVFTPDTGYNKKNGL